MLAKIRLFLVALIGLAALGACASEGDQLSVQEAWARPGEAGMNSAVYFILDNPTGVDDTLVLASGELAERVELHMSMKSDSGAMQMQPQEAVPVPASETVLFEPGGLHVMLIGLQQDLEAGESFPLVLQFSQTGEVQVEVTVRAP